MPFNVYRTTLAIYRNAFLIYRNTFQKYRYSTLQIKKSAHSGCLIDEKKRPHHRVSVY